MRRFETQGPVTPDKNYVVARSEELADFIHRIQQGRYIVLFAPRQTGKTTFFKAARNALLAQGRAYFPIQLNFERYADSPVARFYPHLCSTLCKEIKNMYQKRGEVPSAALYHFLENVQITEPLSMQDFFENLASLLVFKGQQQRLVLIIDEFDGIPQPVVRGFLHSLRYIYLSETDLRCPYSLSIGGVKNITQLNYDRSISPFNIQDEFTLPNFTLVQVQGLLQQYTDETGQPFAPEVIDTLYRQTAGQPFLVNRIARILTAEFDVPKTETIQMGHFSKVHAQILAESNTNMSLMITNIRKDARFEKLLMGIASYEKGTRFNLDNEIISELATYGIIAKGEDGMCEIVNPIYQQRVLRAFQPLVNGLENEYLPEDAERTSNTPN